MVELGSVVRLLGLLGLFSTGNRAQTEKNETAKNDRLGLIGAILDKELVYKIAVACQGQKMYIACSNIYDRLQIRASFYGREDFTTCKHPELPSNKLCAEQNTTVGNVVKDLCQGESQCEVAVNNDFLAQFGTIICPNIYKYLYVKYRCVPKTSLPDVPTIPPASRGETAATTVQTTTGAAVTAPVQCCYVVPGTSTATQGGTVMGGTIIRNKEGTQSVEERIVSEKPQQVLQPSRVTEIINSHPVVGPAPSSPGVSYPGGGETVKLTKPSVAQLEMSTLLQAQAKKLGISSLISIDPSQVGSVVAKPNTEERIVKRWTKNKFLKQTALRRRRRILHGLR